MRGTKFALKHTIKELLGNVLVLALIAGLVTIAYAFDYMVQ